MNIFKGYKYKMYFFQVPVRKPCDNHSDTSGETIQSDSGRGSLDDDHQNMSKSHQSGIHSSFHEFWLTGFSTNMSIVS